MRPRLAIVAVTAAALSFAACSDVEPVFEVTPSPAAEPEPQPESEPALAADLEPYLGDYVGGLVSAHERSLGFLDGWTRGGAGGTAALADDGTFRIDTHEELVAPGCEGSDERQRVPLDRLGLLGEAETRGLCDALGLRISFAGSGRPTALGVAFTAVGELVVELVHEGEPTGARATNFIELPMTFDGVVWHAVHDGTPLRVGLAFIDPEMRAECWETGRLARGVAGAFGYGWVWSSDDNALKRVDPSSGAIETVHEFEGVFPNQNHLRRNAVEAEGRLWIVDSGNIVWVDPESMQAQVFEPFPGTDGPWVGQIARSDGYVWVNSAFYGIVERFDPVTGERELFDVPKGGGQLVATAGAVWLVCEAGDLVRLDTASGETRTVAVPGGVGDLSVHGDRLYLTHADRGRVSTLTPSGELETVIDIHEENVRDDHGNAAPMNIRVWGDLAYVTENRNPGELRSYIVEVATGRVIQDAAFGATHVGPRWTTVALASDQTVLIEHTSWAPVSRTDPGISTRDAWNVHESSDGSVWWTRQLEGLTCRHGA